jgi:23S rRNA (pseudouridine1915-N3)-methyltransferase
MLFQRGYRIHQAVRSAPRRQQLLSRSEGCFRLIIDERGKRFSSRTFAEEIKKIEGNPRKTCALLVGGADGLSERVRERADLLWSVSALTLQHELALVVALEQIYRAHTILTGIPYHRE